MTVAFIYRSEFYRLVHKKPTKFLKECIHKAKCLLAPRKGQKWYEKKIDPRISVSTLK